MIKPRIRREELKESKIRALLRAGMLNFARVTAVHQMGLAEVHCAREKFSGRENFAFMSEWYESRAAVCQTMKKKRAQRQREMK